MKDKFTLTCLEKYIPFAILDLNACLATLSWAWGRTWHAACSPQAYGLGWCLSWRLRFTSFPSGLTLPVSTVVSGTSGNSSRITLPQSNLGSSFISISSSILAVEVSTNADINVSHLWQQLITSTHPLCLLPELSVAPYRPCILLISSPPFSDIPFSSSVLPATFDCLNHS